ncbi:hypothetical protein AX15_003860 [Amanita polypyramis BW_CC]|nr:hypothetical protein AX15_003860 [Amanita polypyramis BW_CC]
MHVVSVDHKVTQLNPNAYSELTKTATPQNQTATANAPTHETGTRTSAGPECFKFLTYKLLRNSLLAIFTLGIPSFHQSLAPGEPELGLKAILSIWKAVRFFDGLLVAMVTTVFKPSVQASITFWIFISCSLVQAIMGLICSTILIIYFSGRCDYHYRYRDVADLSFCSWTIWDLFSVPSMWTAWYGDGLYQSDYY